MIKDRIAKIKKWHSIFSSIIFFVLLGFCIWTVNLKIVDISLSQFGIQKETSVIWNGLLFITGILLYVESVKNLIHHFAKIPRYLFLLFTFSSICLLLTAIVDMSYSEFHNIVAFLYFIGYSSSIFLFGKNLLSPNFRMGMSCIIISLMSIFIPIFLVYALPGLAIPEIVHTIFIFLWMITMAWESEFKNILKRMGF